MSYSSEDDDDVNPLTALTDDFFEDDSDADAPVPQRRTQRPTWGIPTFQDQCNGVNTFTLCHLDNRGQPSCRHAGSSVSNCSCCAITVTLEHRRHSTGSDLWEAALVLAHALDRPPPPELKRGETCIASSPTTTLWNSAHTVLELGSGTGALGLYAARLGAHVVLTDLSPNLDLLRTNRDRNMKTAKFNAQVDIVALDWNDTALPVDLCTWHEAHGDIDLILGSDLFLPYATELLDPLARTLRNVLEQLGHADTCAIVAYEERFDCTAFYESASRYTLHVEHIDNDWLHPMYQDPGRIHVLRIRMAR